MSAGPHEYACKTCGYTCTSNSDFLMHLIAKCQKESSTSSDVSQTKELPLHLKAHSYGPRIHFTCEICGSGFAVSNQLRQHQKPSSIESLFVCDLCGVTAVRQVCIKKHQNLHHKDSIFNGSSLQPNYFISSKLNPDVMRCPYCPQICTDEQLFKSHLLSHKKKIPCKERRKQYANSKMKREVVSESVNFNKIFSWDLPPYSSSTASSSSSGSPMIPSNYPFPPVQLPPGYIPNPQQRPPTHPAFNLINIGAGPQPQPGSSIQPAQTFHDASEVNMVPASQNAPPTEWYYRIPVCRHGNIGRCYVCHTPGLTDFLDRPRN
ncbi:unnamed protein product [Caenorhabditis sp. 36 PRJEB53466]|nr:unnamed protein product [Caenorhabditis sp. 36 PRJEB53466]